MAQHQDLARDRKTPANAHQISLQNPTRALSLANRFSLPIGISKIRDRQERRVNSLWN
jgi:hypothetical protein